GAVIAGLGQFGELTPGELSKTVNRAVLRYVLTLRRRAAEQGVKLEDMEEISLTSLVIGHKGANMTVQQSVQAILEAVADANLNLDKTPVANLEFVELYEDTAYKAASALKSATLNGPVADTFTFDKRLVSGDGAMLRMDYGQESSEWQRISASRSKDDSDVLNFTVIADGAKAHFQQTAVETDVIERLLEQSRKGTATDRDLGRLLFQLMIPLDLKAFAQNDQKIQLILDDSTAKFPWELMEDAVSVLGDGLYQSTGAQDFRPLVVRAPVIRQLVSGGAVVPRVAGKKALVVGDPADTGHAPLLGARNEATRVAQQLKERLKFDVNDFIHTSDSIEILTHVMRADYKIMHFAAHGVYEARAENSKTGLVLSNGVHLTSASIQGMEAVPEFVFLNCCHIGRIEEETGRIAADLARTFIEKGVRAVVAAGWAVNDEAADLFAEEFYDSMHNGNAFGDAVHHARQVVFERFPETNTWGAYQCYGDPEYRFDERGMFASEGRHSRTFYSVEHARKAALNIQSDLASPLRERRSLLSELDTLRETALPDWLEDASWCEDMGRAYAQLDVYSVAIDLLERAKANHRASMTVNALELLEQLKVRSATYAWTQAEHAANRATDAEREEAEQAASDRKEEQRKTVATALENLDALDTLLGSINQRREVLKGTVCKRKVLTIAKGAPRQSALREMIGYYKSAKDLAAKNEPNRLLAHPTYNWLSGHVALGSKDVDGQPFEALFSQFLAQNAVLENNAPTFWTAVLPAEIDILRGLLAAPEERGDIFHRFEETFRYAWKRGGAFNQARSIREHVHFLKFMARNEGQRAWMTRVQAFLNDETWKYRDMPEDEF
ncbi:MAG: CHAT domain-containing protein, partial [Pseudomonadota bacterium]